LGELPALPPRYATRPPRRSSCRSNLEPPDAPFFAGTLACDQVDDARVDHLARVALFVRFAAMRSMFASSSSGIRVLRSTGLTASDTSLAAIALQCQHRNSAKSPVAGSTKRTAATDSSLPPRQCPLPDVLQGVAACAVRSAVREEKHKREQIHPFFMTSSSPSRQCVHGKSKAQKLGPAKYR